VYGADRVPRGGQRAICAAAVRAIRRDDTDTERILPLLAHVTPADFTTHENIWAAQFLTTHLDTPRALPFIHAVFDAELNHHEFAQLIALLAHVDPIQLTTAELLTRLDHLTPRTPDGPDDTPLYHEALTRLMREDFDPEDIAAVIRQAADAGVPISADHKVAIEDTITALHVLSEREWNRTAARGLVAAMIATARAAQTLFPNHHEFLRLQARGHLAIERLLDHDGAKQHGTQGENLRQAVDIMTSLRQRFEGPLEALPRKILITYGLAHKEYSRYLTDNHERERGITSRARNRLHQQAVDATTLAHEKFLDDPEAWLNWGWVRYDEAKKDVVGYEASVVRAESVFDAVERLFRAGHASPVQYAEAHRLYIWTVNETADILIRGEDYETAINQYLHRRDIPTMVLRAQQYVAGAQWGLDWLYGWWRYLYLMGKALSRNRVYWVAEDYGQPDPLATGKVAGLTKRYADFGHAAVGATDYFQAALCILNGPTKILTRSTTAPTAATHAMAQIVNQACDPAHQLPTIRDLDYIRGRPDLYTGSTLGKLGLLAGARQALYSALDTISDEHSQWRNYTRDILVEVNTNLVSVHFPPNHCELSAEILYLLPQLENLYGSAPYRRRLQGAQRVHKALACQQRPALIGTREIQ
jgi:hypothetical protein